MIYDIRHKTTFTYEDVVSVSHHVLHLVPRSHARWGRDYGDVSPINGFIVGGGAHQVAVEVDVTPSDAR